MGWVAFFFLAAVVLIIAVAVWRNWIAPWKDAGELADAIREHRPPRKFLISGMRGARRLGLVLEELVGKRGAVEKRVEESESSVQTVFGAMLDGLAVIDEHRDVRLMNGEFRRVFGLDDKTTSGTLLGLVHNASVERLAIEAIRRGEPQRESIALARGGSEPREMEVSAVPFGENSGTAKGAVLLFRDVSHFQKVEQMRRDFVANVSHELRTPLSILRGYIETLLDDPNQPPGELRRILEIMDRHSDRLTDLVEDVASPAGVQFPGME